MKGEILYKILNALKNGAQDQVDFVNAFLRAGYGASGNRINYELHKIQGEKISRELENARLEKLRKYLSKLKREGLILENKSDQICLTNKGIKKLSDHATKVSPDKYLNNKKVDKKLIVISYDIPVAFNKERRILRDILRMLNFNLIHKSVWVGKVALPSRFINDLSKLEILDYVEILEVTKNGTLKSKN